MSIAKSTNVGLLVALATGLTAAPLAHADLKPIIDGRLRYENVDQAPLAEEADAVTARLRLGIEAGKVLDTSIVVEGEFVTPIVTDYRPDPAVPFKTQYPVVADPESYELNRAHLTNTSIPGTTITLGRQRINLDDQRFVGAVGWRQNEQTYDALRVMSKPGAGPVSIDVTYLNRVNRIFGDGSPQGDYEGDTVLGNIAYQTPIGKLTGFGYFIEIENIPGVAAAVRDSNATYGLRFAGEQPIGKTKLTYAASYAMQEDYADNPLTFELDYVLGEIGLTVSQFSGLVGIEVLDGNGAKGFTTPLATLHKFQGWADKFLGTPPNGLKDIYASLGWSAKGVGPFDVLSATIAYHDFESTRLTTTAEADEINLQLLAKWKKLTAILKYADYNADGLFTDTRKIWVECGFVW